MLLILPNHFPTWKKTKNENLDKFDFTDIIYTRGTVKDFIFRINILVMVSRKNLDAFLIPSIFFIINYWFNTSTSRGQLQNMTSKANCIMTNIGNKRKLVYRLNWSLSILFTLKVSLPINLLMASADENVSEKDS